MVDAQNAGSENAKPDKKAKKADKQQKDKYKKKEKLNENPSSTTYLVQSRITKKLWVIKTLDLKDMPRE